MSRKTFGAVRSRGPIQADESLSIRGVAVVPVRLFVGRVTQEASDDPFLFTLVNTLGSSVACELISRGNVGLSVVGGFVRTRTVARGDLIRDGGDARLITVAVEGDGHILCEALTFSGDNVEGFDFWVTISVYP